MRAATPLAITLLCISAGCGPADQPPAVSIVPSNYSATYPEVRGCRTTAEHISSYGEGTSTISNIRVVASPAAVANYRVAGQTLPAGTFLIKEEFADSTCSTIIGWTVMHKEPGYDAAHGDWHWQRVRASDRAVLEDGRVDRCINCHDTADCTTRDWACTQDAAGN